MRWLAVLPALCLYAQNSVSPALTPEIVRLGQIKAHVQEILSKIPDYTCLQTIERSRRAARTRRFQLVDTLRLEVALVNGREMFAWPGAGHFDDREIGQFVGGTIGNGNFALHARSVFFGHVPRYEYAGEAAVDNKPAYRYNFFIPRFQSGFTLRVEKLQGVAGYHGYFEVDAQSFDLLTLAIETDDIPENLPIAAAKDTMRYARAAIGDKEFLLPKSSELILTDLEGNENRNRVTFTGCRQYTGESVITFADPPPTTEPPPPPPTPVVDVILPDGLYLTVVNDTHIRFETSAIGDPVKGYLLENAKLKGQTIVPRGAIVHGRITSSEKFRGRTEIFRLGIKLTEIEFPGARSEIGAVLEEVTPLPGWSRAGADKQGMIYISGARPEFPRGVRTVWRLRSDTGKANK